MTLPPTDQLRIVALAKHLPPSAAILRLIDIDGRAASLLATLRPDTDILPLTADAAAWSAIADASVDAVSAYSVALSDLPLAAIRRALRPGGRLIVIDLHADPDESAVNALETAGYTRILVEAAYPPLPGALLRGERPHTTDDTAARVAEALRSADFPLADPALADFKGRYLHLLVRATPNKPAWALRPEDVITWEALALATAPPSLIACTSLPNAVALMQPAVVRGQIVGVNKVARYRREVVAAWGVGVRLNPPVEALHDLVFWAIDPAQAEAPVE